jgi:hypothetical protein
VLKKGNKNKREGGTFAKEAWQKKKVFTRFEIF